jgi:hypothetical protein
MIRVKPSIRYTTLKYIDTKPPEPAEDDHRRLLEGVEDEAEPPKIKDHRELQGITNFGDGISNLKFPGSVSRRSLRNTERRRE